MIKLRLADGGYPLISNVWDQPPVDIALRLNEKPPAPQGDENVVDGKISLKGNGLNNRIVTGEGQPFHMDTIESVGHEVGSNATAIFGASFVRGTADGSPGRCLVIAHMVRTLGPTNDVSK